jgi:hypothetical protein
MPNVFQPRLDILGGPQRNLWPELAQTPREFTLYGGTAIALRLGHRQSVDFDFFGPQNFEPQTLLRRVGYLQAANVLQSSANNLTVSLNRGGPVQVTFSANSISDRSPPPTWPMALSFKSLRWSTWPE